MNHCIISNCLDLSGKYRWKHWYSWLTRKNTIAARLIMFRSQPISLKMLCGCCYGRLLLLMLCSCFCCCLLLSQPQRQHNTPLHCKPHHPTSPLHHRNSTESQNDIHWPQLNIMWPVTTSRATTTTTKSTAFRSLNLTFIDQNQIQGDQE